MLNGRPGGKGRKRCAQAAAFALTALLLPAGASAQEPIPSAAQASAQLEEAEAAIAQPDAAAPDATAEIRDLALALPYLEGAERRRARAILARPPATDPGADEGAKWSIPETNNRAHVDSAHFRVHYTTVGINAAQPPFAQKVADYAEMAWNVQNDDLNWPEPLPDGSRGDLGSDPVATNKTDVYLSDLTADSPNASALYGYAAAEGPSKTCFSPPFRCFAYLVLDNDYAEPAYGPGRPDVPLQATVAHEYNHILQFRLDANQDFWMFESTATWAEEKTFPDVDDWITTFMPRWSRTPSVPITRPFSRRAYGSAVWNHWLERHSPAAVLDAWKASRTTNPKDFAVSAYDFAIRMNGGKGFAQEFARFAAATAEWQVVTGAEFPDPDRLPKVEREGTLRRGAKRKSFKLNHTAYRLLRVKPRGRNVVKLKVSAARRVRTGIALVGREGTNSTGTFQRKFKYLPRGGRGVVRLAGARSFNRITAVVANADARARGRMGFDWNYTRDRKPFRVRLR